MLIIQLIYQQVENYIVYPIVYRRAVELSPLTTIVAVLIAGSLLGVVGAILAVPFAAVIKIVAPRGRSAAAGADGRDASAGGLAPSSAGGCSGSARLSCRSVIEALAWGALAASSLVIGG